MVAPLTTWSGDQPRGAATVYTRTLNPYQEEPQGARDQEYILGKVGTSWNQLLRSQQEPRRNHQKSLGLSPDLGLSLGPDPGPGLGQTRPSLG